jgi:hypothetical protein
VSKSAIDSPGSPDNEKLKTVIADMLGGTTGKNKSKRKK